VGARFDPDLGRCRTCARPGGLVQFGHDEEERAALEHVFAGDPPSRVPRRRSVRPQAPGFAGRGAVEEGAVGAAEVADVPALLVGVDLGMAAADGAVVDGDFEGVHAADPQEGLRLPRAALDGPVDAP
jgi:hypothetical protein